MYADTFRQPNNWQPGGSGSTDLPKLEKAHATAECGRYKARLWQKPHISASVMAFLAKISKTKWGNSGLTVTLVLFVYPFRLHFVGVLSGGSIFCTCSVLPVTRQLALRRSGAGFHKVG